MPFKSLREFFKAVTTLGYASQLKALGEPVEILGDSNKQRVKQLKILSRKEFFKRVSRTRTFKAGQEQCLKDMRRKNFEEEN